jgi:TetR/AcrR family transcriptional repressor of bet genes
MPKVGLQPIRRRQLIEATVATIHAHGYDETTMARIGRRAGMSPGLIAHYFGSKNELLVATMRALLTDLQRELVRRLTAAPTPFARLEAIVSANFDETQCRPEVVTAWLSFWSQVPHAPELARLQEVYRKRLRSNLRHALRELGLEDAGLEEAAETLGSLIDGIWVRAALSGHGLDFVAARRRVLAMLDLMLGAQKAA